MRLDSGEQKGGFGLGLKEYKTMETKLYGELVKTCRSYTNRLNIISMVGILDLVKQEMVDLDKSSLQFMQDEEQEDLGEEQLL